MEIIPPSLRSTSEGGAALVAFPRGVAQWCASCAAVHERAHTPWTHTTDPLLVRGFPLSTPRLTLCPLGLLIDLTCYKLPNLAAIAVKNGTLKDSISVYLPLINIGLLSLDLIYLPLEQVHYYVLGRYDIFMEIWGLFMEYIKIK